MLMIDTDSRNLLPIPKLGKSFRNLRHDRVEPLAAQADSGEWGHQSSARIEVSLGVQDLLYSLQCSDDGSSYNDRYQSVSGTGVTMLAILAILWPWQSDVRPPQSAAPPLHRPARPGHCTSYLHTGMDIYTCTLIQVQQCNVWDAIRTEILIFHLFGPQGPLYG